MKIQILSDIHLEFYRTHQKFFDVSVDYKDRVLVLAGDIGQFEKSYTYEYFIEDASERFHSVIWVPGNHEYYNGTYPRSICMASEAVKHLKNVYLGNRFVTVIDDVFFIAATLWTDLNKNDWFARNTANDRINDFHVINLRKTWNESFCKFRAEDSYEEHLCDKKFIFNAALDFNDKKLVVISHHAPSEQSIHPSFKGELLNSAFASDLDKEIFQTNIKLWFHGHTHDSFDYKIGGTRVIANPAGYPHEKNPNFVKEFVVEI